MIGAFLGKFTLDPLTKKRHEDHVFGCFGRWQGLDCPFLVV